jgi:hypothetical protein
MATQLRFSQGETTGTWGQAARASAGAEVTVEGQATGTTVIASWQLLCHYAHDDDGIQPTPEVPVLLAQAADASPTYAFTPANPGAYLLELRTYAVAGYTGTITRDVRELRVVHERLNDCAPSVPSVAAQALITVQVAAGLGRHDNFGGYAWGYGGPAGGPGLAYLYESIEQLLEAVDTAQSTAEGAAGAAGDAAEAAATAQGTAESAAGTAADALEAAATAQGAAEAAQGTANDALEAAGTAQYGVDALTPLVVPTALTWTSAALTLTRSGTIEYTGSDDDVELTGVGPHTPGAVVAIKFPAGSISGEHVVTLGDSLGPLDSQDDGEDFDPTLDYYVVVTALGAHQLTSTCRVEVVADTTAPQITAATIASGAANVVALTTSESVTCAAATGFSVAGYTVSGISGSGTSWALALTGPVTPGATVSVAWSSSNVMQDASGNPLAAGSRNITNNAAYPTVSTAAITPAGTQLSVTYSRAVADTTGASLDLTGTDATVTGVASGSGTATIVYTLSGTVVGGTITLAVSSPSGIAATDGLSVQAATGISVTSDAEYPTLESCTVDGAAATLVWSEACTASSLDIGDFTFSAGTDAEFDSLTSGSGTDTWIFALDPAAEAEEEFTLSIAAGSGVVSTATGLALQASAAEVTNETAAGYLWQDLFDRADTEGLDNGWTGAFGGTGRILSNALQRTDSSGYAAVYNMCAAANLPANIRVTITIPHARLSDSDWGIACRVADGCASGMTLQYNWQHVWSICDASGYGAAPTSSITETGGLPASWSVDQNHTVAIEIIGSAGRVILDGEEYGTFTSTINQGTSGLGVAIVALGYNRSWLDVTVEAAS